MIDHISIEVSDYQKSLEFYTKALASLGYILVMEVHGFAGFGPPNSSGPIAHFWIHQANVQTSHKMHIAFRAKNRTMVNSFYQAAIAAGARDNGQPGIREIYHPNYYGAFVFDPDGYNIEAVCHQAE